jgi:hypothetical protein
MKLIAIIFSFSLAFMAARAAFGDDIVGSNAGKQNASKPTANVRTTRAQPKASLRNTAVPASKNRFGNQPNLRIRQNYSEFQQPIGRGPLAMNVQRTPGNYRPTEMPGQLGRGHKAGGKNDTNSQAGGGNNQAAIDNRRSYFDALKRCRHERHDRNWWNRHCRTIVFVNTGYYYLDTGYWYPAYGYNPTYDYYDNDGPIYTYGDLLPDQVIANVQAALREAGYYVGPITGSLGPGTRAALSNFQRDYGLIITGAIDEPTVQSLGLT